jgi:hypothetical protein
MLGLRTEAGVDLQRYQSLFGERFDAVYRDVLSNPIVSRSTFIDDRRFAVLPQYLYVSNQVSVLFMRFLYGE